MTLDRTISHSLPSVQPFHPADFSKPECNETLTRKLLGISFFEVNMSDMERICFPCSEELEFDTTDWPFKWTNVN